MAKNKEQRAKIKAAKRGLSVLCGEKETLTRDFTTEGTEAPDALDFDADGDLSEMVDVGAYAFGAETIGTTWLTYSLLKKPAPPTGLRAFP